MQKWDVDYFTARDSRLYYITHKWRCEEQFVHDLDLVLEKSSRTAI